VVSLAISRAQIAPGESPLKGLSHALVVLLEGQQSILQLAQGAKIIGRECLRCTTVVHDPEHTLGAAVRPLRHGLRHAIQLLPCLETGAARPC